MRNEMTRYSKNPDRCNRTNTLVTIKEGDLIFFGISRCNKTAGDTFLKSKGSMVAKARAIRAKIEGREATGEFTLYANGLRGSCSQANIRSLLEYFDNVDTIMYNDAISSDTD